MVSHCLNYFDGLHDLNLDKTPVHQSVFGPLATELICSIQRNIIPNLKTSISRCVLQYRSNRRPEKSCFVTLSPGSYCLSSRIPLNFLNSIIKHMPRSPPPPLSYHMVHSLLLFSITSIDCSSEPSESSSKCFDKSTLAESLSQSSCAPPIHGSSDSDSVNDNDITGSPAEARLGLPIMSTIMDHFVHLNTSFEHCRNSRQLEGIAGSAGRYS